MFRRWISSVTSRFKSTPEEATDPEIDIRATLDEARGRDQDLRNQAARVIAHKVRLFSQIERAADSVGTARMMAKQALLEAEHAKSAGDDAAATKWAHAAQSLAVRWQSAEDKLASLKGQYETAVDQAEQAKDAMRENALKTQEVSIRRLEMWGSPEQVEMQETVDHAVQSMSTSIVDDNPGLDAIESAIEQRTEEAMAKAGLPDPTPVEAAEELLQAVNVAEAEAKLDELRSELGL